MDKQEKETLLQSIFLSLMFSRLNFLHILRSHFIFSNFTFDYLVVGVADLIIFACLFICDINYDYSINFDPHLNYRLWKMLFDSLNTVQLMKK